MDDMFSEHKSGGSQQEVLLKYNLFTCTHGRVRKGGDSENTAVQQEKQTPSPPEVVSFVPFLYIFSRFFFLCIVLFLNFFFINTSV